MTPIISVGDPLPGNQDNADPERRVWAPTPDGLGAYRVGTQLIVYANHELSKDGVDGQFTHARVSRLVLDIPTLSVVSGTYALTAAELLERLCSATWVDGDEGLTGGYFLTGEESDPTADGSVALAISRSGTITQLPWLGRFAHENQFVVPGFGSRVVVAGLDDSRGKSELYLYVAASESDFLSGNGKLYVFATDEATHSGNLTVGAPINGYFLEVPDPTQSAADLQTTVDNVGDHGAFPFVRLEDGDYDHRAGVPFQKPAIYFVDTGSESTTGRVAGKVNASCGSPCDPYGSIYRLELDPTDPTQHARLVLLARSRGIAAGDWASPDNIAAGRQSLMLQEDPAYGGFARAPRVWNFNITANGGLGAARALVALDNDDCVDALGTCWESSGIIDASEWLGAGTWLFDVQGHTLPVPSLELPSEGGQLLMLRFPGS